MKKLKHKSLLIFLFLSLFSVFLSLFGFSSLFTKACLEICKPEQENVNTDERHASKHHNDFASGTDTVQPAVSCGMLFDQKLPGTEFFLLHV